jgi:holliday junction DNA helicase RuvA
MINSLRGTVIEHAPSQILLETSAIGFIVAVANEQLFGLGHELTIPVYFHWHPENGPQLFGFTCQAERAIFALVVSAPGFGPKIALAIIRALSPSAVATALACGDIKTLSSITGIGPKKAEAMILQLRDKASKLITSGLITSNNPHDHIKKITDVLNSLNYSRSEISTALAHLKNIQHDEANSFDGLLRQVLSFLSKKVHNS